MEQNQIVIYQTEDNAVHLEVKMSGEMIWLTRQQLATLFDRDYKTISKHINNALKEELADSVVVAKFANTTQHDEQGTVLRSFILGNLGNPMFPETPMSPEQH